VTVIVGFMLVSAITGCGGGRDDGGGVIARVNGVEITMARFQEYYRPALTPYRTPEEEYQTLEQRLDELIRYYLIQEQARKDGFLKDPMYLRRLEAHEITILNQLVKLHEIDSVIEIDDADVEAYLARADTMRHFQHILTLNQTAANEVTEMLTEGREWEEVALQYSQDSDVSEHKGDLGWLVWDEGPFGVYGELQEIAYSIPVGTWQGPIQVGNEYHFIKVVEAQERPKGPPEQDWHDAYAHLSGKRAEELEQQMVNRFWEEGGYHLDEDQFRWLLDQISVSFNRNRNVNPIPDLTPEDMERVVVRSDSDPWTAEMILQQLELLTSSARDNAETYEDWRERILGWVISARIAEYARDRGYDKDPVFSRRMNTFIETALNAEQVLRLRRSVRHPTHEELVAYYEEHREDFDLPERRRLIEVLVATREEAEEVRAQVVAGRSIEVIAAERTIRPGFKENLGRFAPIRREEFGALGEAVFETELGEVGPIVETPMGFSVFVVTNIMPAEDLTLEDIEENLSESLYQQERTAVVDRFVEQEWRRARIWKDYDRLRTYSEQISAATARADSTAGAAAADPPGPGVHP
jgi:parvulin-like peptidyl-prolyl isomerase